MHVQSISLAVQAVQRCVITASETHRDNYIYETNTAVANPFLVSSRSSSLLRIKLMPCNIRTAQITTPR